VNIYIPGDWLYGAGLVLILVGSWVAALLLTPKPPQRPPHALPSQWEPPPVTFWQAAQTPLLVILFMFIGIFLLLELFESLGIRT
jgi:hypothetical protein